MFNNDLGCCQNSSRGTSAVPRSVAVAALGPARESRHGSHGTALSTIAIRQECTMMRLLTTDPDSMGLEAPGSGGATAVPDRCYPMGTPGFLRPLPQARAAAALPRSRP